MRCWLSILSLFNFSWTVWSHFTSVSDRQTNKDNICEYEHVPRVYLFKRKKNFPVIHFWLLLDYMWE